MNNDVTRRDWNFVAVHESEQIVGRRERYKKEKVKTFDVFYIYYVTTISTTVDTFGAV